ncbi:MAG: PaaI family thioesterase [Anaerolineales bacterium]
MPTMKVYLEGWLAGSLPPPPIAQLMGISLRDCKQGASTMEMRVGPAHHNPLGTVHGGVLCDLSDAAMGTAVASLLGPDETFTTVELAAHYFIPLREGLLTARARVLRRGRLIAYVECEVTDEKQRLVGKFTSTCLMRSGTQSEGPAPTAA